MRLNAFTSVLVLTTAAVASAELPPPESPPPATAPAPSSEYVASLSADFAMRDALPQTEVPESKWYDKSELGPPSATYPPVEVPGHVADPLQWKRDRVVEVALHFLGTPYDHRHFPEAGGLDCSNFTAWVYNYGFGLRFTSSTPEQAEQAGRLLAPEEPLQKGDLLFIWNAGHDQIGHAAIYVDDGHIIDSTSSASPDGVGLRPFAGWYRERFSHARRILE